MKSAAIIQARMGSSRLPGKVMMTLCGDSVLKHIISRVSSCRSLDDIIVATTTLPDDDIIVDEAEGINVTVFRGSKDDVLGRYYHAATDNNLDIIVRITADCPLIDPAII
jgi:spore coat polysaccharide biosynthesis protein SpsF